MERMPSLVRWTRWTYKCQHGMANTEWPTRNGRAGRGSSRRPLPCWRRPQLAPVDTSRPAPERNGIMLHETRALNSRRPAEKRSRGVAKPRIPLFPWFASSAPVAVGIASGGSAAVLNIAVGIAGRVWRPSRPVGPAIAALLPCVSRSCSWPSSVCSASTPRRS